MRRPSDAESTDSSLESSLVSLLNLTASASSLSTESSTHRTRRSFDSNGSYEIILPSTSELPKPPELGALSSPPASRPAWSGGGPSARPAWGEGKSPGARRRRRVREAKARARGQVKAEDEDDADVAERTLAALLEGTSISDRPTRPVKANVKKEQLSSSADPRVKREPSYLGDSLVLVPSGRTTPTVMSSEDASSSIDSFLTDTKSFTSVQANKLRLWQALCIELGLVELESPVLPDLPYKSPRPSSISPASSTSSSRSITPTREDPLPCLPHSLKQVKALLQTKAHVNLVDYLDARAAGSSPADIQALMYPSKNKLLKALKAQRKWVKLERVKVEWLNPLLKDFAFGRRWMA